MKLTAAKRLLIILVSVLLLVVGLGISAQPAQACSCAINLDPLSEASRSSAVFSGKVLEIREEKHAAGERIKKVLIEVDQIWKGIDQNQMWIYTAYSEPACGVDFDKGQSYLIYAMADEGGRLNVSLCSRTASIQLAGEDLQALGTGAEPEREVDLLTESADSTMNLALIIIAGGLLVIAAVGVGYLLLVKRRPRN
ncbi:hypothetical protein [Paenibacillus senegalensis]|uniref:hypothetical protein n=1 Tax=Paenibacillus senegalensis TaxID=1465766 RepID=UPI000287E2D2|nr:hypothetical protein [Paenibacillus senegalensis]